MTPRSTSKKSSKKVQTPAKIVDEETAENLFLESYAPYNSRGLKTTSVAVLALTLIEIEQILSKVRLQYVRL